MDDRQLRRELRLLKGYALMTTALLATLTLTASRRTAREKFTEIDVQRINVVEPDGRYRIVISNRPRSIGPIYKSKPFGYPGGSRPGIIFFNDEGTENGGLTFTGQRNPDGTYRASTHLSFDQFNEDQVLNLDYADNNGRRQTGFSVDDRYDIDIHDLVVRRDSINRIADTTARAAALRQLFAPRNGVPSMARRVFLGRNPAKEALLSLADRNGNARIRLVVDSLGTPSLEFLDAAGAVTVRLPQGKP
jgi:hypothetical protein